MDNNVAGGLGAGLLSYAQTSERLNQQDKTNALNQQYADMAKQNQKAQFLQNGIQVDADGNVGYDDVHKQLQALAGTNKLSAEQQQADAYDPNEKSRK